MDSYTLENAFSKAFIAAVNSDVGEVLRNPPTLRCGYSNIDCWSCFVKSQNESNLVQELLLFLLNDLENHLSIAQFLIGQHPVSFLSLHTFCEFTQQGIIINGA